jgi:hypothetical protein
MVAALAIVVLMPGLMGVVGVALRALARRRAAHLPQSPRRPLQVVAADLRRLARQLSLVPAGAPMLRRQALLAAYDAVLIEVAELLEVPHELGVMTPLGMGPAVDPFEPARASERVRLLAALEDAGLAVRA